MKIVLNDYNPSEIIRFIRQSTDLTQRQFGKKIGKSEDTVQSYELGRNKMTLNKFLEIAKMFNIKVTMEEDTTKK